MSSWMSSWTFWCHTLHRRVIIIDFTFVAVSLRTFDFLSGYHPDKMTKEIVLNRAIFLETVAAVPGMAGSTTNRAAELVVNAPAASDGYCLYTGGMMRHLSSLRNMRRDHGWIHTLLEEAENERMHLLVFVSMKRPGPLFRLAVIGAQVSKIENLRNMLEYTTIPA